MGQLLDTVILDNSLRTYLWGLFILGVVYLLNRYFSRYVAGLLFRLLGRWFRGIDKKDFTGLVVGPLQTFVLILVTLTVLEKLNFPRYTFQWGGITLNSNFRIFHTDLQTILETGGVIILILSFVWVLLRIIDFLALVMEKRSGVAAGQSDHQLIVFFKDFFKVILAIIGLLLILKFGFGWNIANLVTGLSIVGAAIALATRESLENLIASFIIFFDKPFSTGDLVKVQQITGTVEKIGLRSTRIRTEQKTYVTVPNKQMVDSIMDNLSMRSHRRALLLLEFHSSNGVVPIESFIEEARKMLEAQRPEIESYSVYLTDIQKNAFVVQVEFFSPPMEIGIFHKLREQVSLALLKSIESRKLRLIQKEPGEMVG